MDMRLEKTNEEWQSILASHAENSVHLYYKGAYCLVPGKKEHFYYICWDKRARLTHDVDKMRKIAALYNYELVGEGAELELIQK